MGDVPQGFCQKVGDERLGEDSGALIPCVTPNPFLKFQKEASILRKSQKINHKMIKFQSDLLRNTHSQ